MRSPRALPLALAGWALSLFAISGCSDDEKTTNPPPAKPAIESLEPDTMVAGTTARVRGEGFGSSRGTSQLLFGTRNAQSLDWRADRIVAVIPDDVTAGNLTVVAGGQTSDPLAYKVGSKAPRIEQVNPASGEVGATVRIEGRLFGVSKQEGKVFFGALEATTTAWGDTVLQAVIPAGAQTGTIRVRARNLDSNEVPFTVIAENLPVIEAVEPDSAGRGTDVKIRGHFFGDTGLNGNVRIGGAPAPISSWSDTLVEASVGTEAPFGDQFVQVSTGTRSSNLFPFRVIQPIEEVVITLLEPARTTVSDIITIHGTGFRSPSEDPTVTFQGASGRLPTTVTVADATTIRAWVPPGAVDGPVIVQFGDQVSEGAFFSVSPRRYTFTSDIHPLFEDKGCLGCHSGAQPPANLKLETKFDTLDDESDHGPVVTLRNGPESKIVQKVGPNPPFGVRMPFGCTTNCLSAEEILMLSDWIDQGADN